MFSTSNASGALIARQTYFPYGAVRTTSGTLPTDYTFTGQRLDADAGLLYYGARYYDAALGRFTQPDTIVPDQYNPQALNRYSYVLNNPVKYTDPTGHMQTCADGDLGGGCSRTETLDDIFGLYETNPNDLVDDLMRGWFRANPDYDIDADSALHDLEKAYAGLINGQAVLEAVAEAKSPDWGRVFKTATSMMAAGTVLAGLDDDIPVLVIDSRRMPNIAKNILNAQKNGAPKVLHRTEDPTIIGANRDTAISRFKGKGSPDEYPFASTYEGGSGAFVQGVPLKEQRIQGGVLWDFYRRYGIKDGNAFRVIVK